MTAVSIIMPTLNEAAGIVSALARLSRDFPEAELIVVDGGSTDGTADLARTFAKVIESAPGRGGQLNAGASVARGDILWFVHADTAIDPAALVQLHAVLEDPRVVGGGLSLRFDRDSASLRWLAWSSDQRARRLGQIFGDQAMFVRRTVFDRLGGFPDYPLMEDFEFSRRLRRTGRLALLSATSTTSARRFEEHGTWPMVVLMQVIKIRYLLGATPESLRDRYAAGPRSLFRRPFSTPVSTPTERQRAR
jgi:rSAM/selenodomain-associated transferase 2